MKALIVIAIFTSFALFAAPSAVRCPEAMEMSGEEEFEGEARYDRKVSMPRGPVLLIPLSGDKVVGMFDPYDGTYMGDVIVDDSTGTNYEFKTIINAVQGPGDFIFVSDQVADAVFAFDEYGDFLYVAASPTYLNNVRGIDFRNDTLFVTSGDDYVAMFSGPDQFAGYFIQDGSDPFDILFVDDMTTSTALLSDIQGTTDNVRHYDFYGLLIEELFQVNFPEQIVRDIANPGHFLNASFSANTITEFLIDGTILNTWSFSSGRGVFRLGNGNLLATNGTGVHEIDVATGAIVDTKYSGQSRFIELVDIPVTSIEGSPWAGTRPVVLSVGPNPFEGHLSIGVTLPGASSVEVDIYSVDGRLVRTISPGELAAGVHAFTWDGTSNEGVRLGQGVYLVRVITEEGTQTAKVSLVR